MTAPVFKGYLTECLKLPSSCLVNWLGSCYFCSKCASIRKSKGCSHWFGWIHKEVFDRKQGWTEQEVKTPTKANKLTATGKTANWSRQRGAFFLLLNIFFPAYQENSLSMMLLIWLFVCCNNNTSQLESLFFPVSPLILCSSIIQFQSTYHSLPPPPPPHGNRDCLPHYHIYLKYHMTHFIPTWVLLVMIEWSHIWGSSPEMLLCIMGTLLLS